MSDWELLERAAKAAGMVIEFDDEGCCMHRGMEWTPLTDDGDALRLAVELQMDVFVRAEWAEAVAPMGAPQKVWFGLVIKHRTEAVRRAIVRAAAATVSA
jgi:hypothetical protein